MNTFDLDSVNIGPVRIGGFIGHGLVLGKKTFFLALRSTLLRKTILTLVAGSAIIFGGIRGIRAITNWKAQSPIEKDVYLVEDMRDGGQYIVVRHGSEHIKLHCERNIFVDPTKNQWTDNSYGCTVQHPGNQIVLEKWDDRTYVFKKGTFNGYTSEGEDDFSVQE
jgi:hypothetical protein